MTFTLLKITCKLYNLMLCFFFNFAYEFHESFTLLAILCVHFIFSHASKLHVFVENKVRHPFSFWCCSPFDWLMGSYQWHCKGVHCVSLAVDDKAMLRYIRDRTAAPYFSNLVWFIGNHILDVDLCVRHDMEWVLCLYHFIHLCVSFSFLISYDPTLQPDNYDLHLTPILLSQK